MQTFNGKDYLKIDIANNYGHDKLTWHERIKWFDQHESQLDTLIPQAKEPALYYAGIKAYRDVLAGKPIGYMVSLDATSSGLQLLACLTGDRSAAQLCNVVDTTARRDAYTLVYDYMLSVLGDTSKISRADTKQAIMTAFYGSTAMPKLVFGDGALLDVFYSSLETLAPAAWTLNETMLALWNPDTLMHSWVLPDNFHVNVKVMARAKDTVNFLNQPFEVFYNINAPTEEGRSLGANTIHSIDGMIVREMTRRCDYNVKQIEKLYRLVAAPNEGLSTDRQKDFMAQELWNNYQITGYLSARILDYLDDQNMGLFNRHTIKNLLDSLPKKPFKVVSIHDCFRCLPHYANDLRKQYNLQLQLIAGSRLLESIISQLVHQHVPITKRDPDMYLEIIDSNYALS